MAGSEYSLFDITEKLDCRLRKSPETKLAFRHLIEVLEQVPVKF